MANQRRCLETENGQNKHGKRPCSRAAVFNTRTMGGWHDSERCHGLEQATDSRRSVDHERMVWRLSRVVGASGGAGDVSGAAAAEPCCGGGTEHVHLR